MIEAKATNPEFLETPAAVVSPAPAWVPAGWYFGFDPIAQKAPAAATATIPAYVPESDHTDAPGAPRDSRCTVSYIGQDGTVHYYGQVIYSQALGNADTAGTKINCPPKGPSRYSPEGKIQSKIRAAREAARNQSLRARSQ